MQPRWSTGASATSRWTARGCCSACSCMPLPSDANGVGDLLRRIKPLYCWLRTVFADSIYNRVAALLACFLLGLTLLVIRRIPGMKGFVVLPRRWVVERTFGWLGQWRRLSKDYEQLPEVSEAMVTLAMIRLMLHRTVHPNRKRLPAP